jgi:hypothetical protein
MPHLKGDLYDQLRDAVERGSDIPEMYRLLKEITIRMPPPTRGSGSTIVQLMAFLEEAARKGEGL